MVAAEMGLEAAHSAAAVPRLILIIILIIRWKRFVEMIPTNGQNIGFS